MINRVLFFSRFDDPVTKKWATNGVLRVKYVTFHGPKWLEANLFVLVLKKNSNSYGYMVLYNWRRKKKCEAFDLVNDSIVTKERYGWDATAPLWGIQMLELFKGTLRKMAKMPVVEIPVKEATRTCTKCTYYGKPVPPPESH